MSIHSHSSDRNLLFGVLALQADLIDSARFAEACSAWASRKDVPLADVLVQRGWLSAEERGHVEFLLGRKLQKHHRDARAGLAEVTTDLVKRSLAALNGTGPAVTDAARPPSRRRRYQVLHAYRKDTIRRPS